ncbi:hypothetical protein UFOVP1305_5 [uncultured Caudovirales phage]|jgi:hypothetical protein|uniref:Uncharacterized protein n=1 Tax=uncultured Caudovirales phage TaxID=2100421 RepID=A0A6J5RYQ6_9CAUD|nr:hypothetical protein UFOVP896_43 [uncultured Caudovirales phage]CAB4197294.1 hypothetical protein UFOVP1305_5 [uncultured Caudovirales phage]
MKFEIGKTYTTGEGRDYVWHFTVVARTKKFITILNDSYRSDEKVRVGVSEWQGVERALPLGSFSMAPVITADRTI